MTIVLGVETATPWTAVGLCEGEAILAERSVRCRGGHASGLPELVSEVLDSAGRSAREIGAVAVSIGPGSFTGLRVGLGFAKGVALARGVPLIAVGTLAALAQATKMEGRIACCLDARKQEVYLAIHEARGGWVLPRLEPVAVPPEQVESCLRQHGPVDLFVGDGAERYPGLGKGLRVRPLDDCCPSGGQVARLGGRERAVVDPGSLVPFYARLPAAEVPLT